MQTPKISIGQTLIDEIMDKSHFIVEESDDPAFDYMVSWNGNAPEQIEACIVEWLRPHVDQEIIDKLLNQ